MREILSNPSVFPEAMGGEEVTIAPSPDPWSFGSGSFKYIYSCLLMVLKNLQL